MPSSEPATATGKGLPHGEGILFISSIDWDFIWQGHQEIATRLAQAGNQVLFIENTGVRTVTWADIPRLLSRLRNWWGSVQGFREPRPNLIVLSPLLLPFPYSRAARWLNARLMNRAIAKWMAASKVSSPILWTFLPTPIVHDIIDEFDPAVVVYYCIDNFEASSIGARSVVASETRLFQRADLVFVTSHELQKRAQRARPKAHIFPFAVDFEAFERCRAEGSPAPADIDSIPRPRCGYVGGIHHAVDMHLLRAAALSRPSHHFVLIGPRRADTSPVDGLPNVHLLGSRPHQALPSYIGAFDSGMIPYRLTPYTESVYPTKLNEYLAMGIPVVSTALPEVVAYNRSHQGIIGVARDAESFVSLLDASLAQPAADRAARIAVARRNGWTERLREMSALLIERLREKRAAPQAMAGLLRRLAARYRRATVAAILIFAMLYGIVFRTPVVWRLAEALRVSQPPVPADAIVVIAEAAGESGALGQSHEERVKRAIQLYQQGFARKIVLCSGMKWTYSELEVMRAIAMASGISNDDIVLEPRGGSTRGLIEGADRIARVRSWDRILLVTSVYHAKRALLVWRKLNPQLHVVPTPVEQNRFYSYSAARTAWQRPGPTWTQLRGLLQEAAALALYRFRGWI